MKPSPFLALLSLSVATSLVCATDLRGAEKAPEKATVLWDSWYTVTAIGNTPYGYYNDRFERKGDRIAFKNQFWKREEGYINEEQVVAIAADDATLSPEFWNFRSSYRATTVDIDGSFKGNILTAKVREGTKSLAPITHSVSKKTFLSVMFPVWISRRLPEMKPGRGQSMSVLFEDSFRNKFMPFGGNARLNTPDEFSKKSNTQKVTVKIDGRESTWYVLPTGEPVRIDMSSQNLRVDKVPEAVARRFLIDESVPAASSTPATPPTPTR